jgi:hypothetical protein
MPPKFVLFAFVVLTLCLPGTLNAASPAGESSARQELTSLEELWLHASDASTLERILAPDFVHVIPFDRFLNRQEHIDWVVKHPAPADRRLRFGRLQIRFYGAVGIVNGTVIAADPAGKELDRTAFTDVFVRRHGRWQAVNAQENRIEPGPK